MARRFQEAVPPAPNKAFVVVRLVDFSLTIRPPLLHDLDQILCRQETRPVGHLERLDVLLQLREGGRAHGTRVPRVFSECVTDAQVLAVF